MKKRAAISRLKHIGLGLLLLCAVIVKGQDTSKDSLAAASLLAEAKSTFFTDKPATISKSLAGLAIAERINNKTLQGNFNNVIGTVYIYDSKFEASLKYLEKAKEFAIAAKDNLLLSKVYNNLGLNYMQQGKQLPAIEESLNAIKILHDIGNTTAFGDTYANISNSYIRLEIYDKAKVYADSALKYFLLINKQSGIANIYNNYGLLAVEKKQYPKALEYYEKSIKIKEQLNDKGGQATCYTNIGTIYSDLKNYKKSLEYYRRSEKLSMEINDPKGIATARANMAQLKGLRKDSTGIADAEKAFEYAKKNSALEEQKGVALALVHNYRVHKDFEKALFYHKVYDSIENLTINETMLKQIALLETRFQTGEKQQRIVLLSKQNTIQQLQINKKNLTIFIIAIAFLLTGIIVYQFYSRNKIKQAANLQAAILHQQNLAIKGIIDAEERERKRIAADLHDGVGQLFSAVKLNLDVLIERFMMKGPDAVSLSERTMAMVDESCAEVRSIAHQMMPNSLIKSGLVSALRDFVNKIQSDRLKIMIQTQGIDKPLESNVEIVLYRVIQESVNNVIKHANATLLDIFLLCDAKEITVTIEDNGRGFDTADRTDFTGIGLKNMVSRVEFLKGSVEVSSTPGKGTVVAIYVPLG